MPSADISTIRARRTSECGKLRERAIEALRRHRFRHVTGWEMVFLAPFQD
jgi:hypothetical protein